MVYISDSFLMKTVITVMLSDSVIITGVFLWGFFKQPFTVQMQNLPVKCLYCLTHSHFRLLAIGFLQPRRQPLFTRLWSKIIR